MSGLRSPLVLEDAYVFTLISRTRSLTATVSLYSSPVCSKNAESRAGELSMLVPSPRDILPSGGPGDITRVGHAQIEYVAESTLHLHYRAV